MPTVITDVSLEADVFNAEPFGLIAEVRGFDSLEDAIAEANRLPYGLAGYAFTRSFKNVHLLTHGVEVGMLCVDQPAGDTLAGDAVQRREGFRLRFGRRPGSARAVSRYEVRHRDGGLTTHDA